MDAVSMREPTSLRERETQLQWLYCGGQELRFNLTFDLSTLTFDRDEEPTLIEAHSSSSPSVSGVSGLRRRCPTCQFEGGRGEGRTSSSGTT